MSYYDDSSLFFSPNGYKASVLFAQKPMDTNGQLTFTRASSATRVASNGLIEKVRTNLQPHSQNFSNAVWTKSAGATLTHSETDPNGGTTASRLQMPSGTSNFLAASSITGLTNGGKYTHSVYMKSNTGSTQSVRILDGVRGAAGGSLTASVTTSWQRFDVVITTASTSAGLQVDNQGGAFANDILIAFAQTEESDFGATDYIATTTAAVSVGPVSGLPRLDYLGSTCPRLLLEPQRTNLVTFSEQFDNAAWTKTNATITANNSVSPDGYTNADKIVADTVVGVHAVQRGIAVTSGSAFTFSVYAKKSEYDFVRVTTGTSGGAGLSTRASIVNLTNGNIVSETVLGQTKVIDANNGWYRISVTTSVTTGTGSPTFFVGALNNSAGTDFAGNDSDGIFIWGAQLEAGAYATSYIPTLGASVTRVAELAQKTGISSLIGQTEGVLFLDYTAIQTDLATSEFSISAGTIGNAIRLRQTTDNKLQGLVQFGGSGVALITTSFFIAVGQRYKLAIAYANNDFAFYVNGVLIGVDSLGSVPACSQIQNTSGGGSTAANLAGAINQVLLFKTRLSNSELSQLTTL
jgi:hypothetical protein